MTVPELPPISYTPVAVQETVAQKNDSFQSPSPAEKALNEVAGQISDAIGLVVTSWGEIEDSKKDEELSSQETPIGGQ